MILRRLSRWPREGGEGVLSRCGRCVRPGAKTSALTRHRVVWRARCRRVRGRVAVGVGLSPSRLQSFGRGRHACSMSQPAFRLFEKIPCPSKGGMEYDFTWHRRQQVRRCRTGRLVAMKIPATEPHCSDLQVCHPRAWVISFVRSQSSGWCEVAAGPKVPRLSCDE